MVTIDDFQKLDIRVGKIVSVEDFPEARKPSYKLTIDFGTEIEVKRSSVQLVSRYTKKDLTGKKILGIVNLPPRQIGPFISDVLTLGVPDEKGECIIIIPENDHAIVGGRLF